MAGLAPDNLPAASQNGLGTPAPSAGPVVVEITDRDDFSPDVDEKNNIVRINHGDGSVTVSLDGRPIEYAERERREEWFSNLVDDIDGNELSGIADTLLRAIDEDIESRREWIEDRTLGLRLLGLKIEIPGLQGGSDGAPVEGMSKVRHPLLLEACLRFQANARSELLPTDGPVKIRVDDPGADLEADQLANALEMDLNHYLTVTASEYYPDTDKMLLLLGFGGTEFKKVYFCPLRERPVSETVDADDLIVNNAATDLRNARRVTHRTYLAPSVVKRMQILGVWRDINLGDATQPDLDSVQREKKAQQGLMPDPTNVIDRYREIYEVYCELDIKGFEHTQNGKITGLEIPYVVTLDVSSRTVLSIIRNYDEDTQDLPEAKTRFVKYSFVPGFGFYDIGLVHILGNSTNALTAAWREMLDNGMFANFPGFLIAKSGSRQNSNILRVAPGAGVQVDTQGQPIGQMVMPLPYQTQGMPALMSLVGDIAQTGMRVGGTSEYQVGEGRADAPVGTTLAMIEQATKILNSVHKRMHAAQCEEFRLIVQCFREHPESFWQRPCASRSQWNEQTFLAALDKCELTPQADPNTSSHGQRVMKLVALKQLQAQNPSMYDPIAIDRAAIQAIGFNNPDQFFAPPSAQAQPPPELQEMIQKAKVAQQGADAKTMDAKARMMEAEAKARGIGAFTPRQDGLASAQQQQQIDPVQLMTAKARLMDAQTGRVEATIKHQDAQMEDHNRDLDRQSRERIAFMNFVREVLADQAQAEQVRQASAEGQQVEKAAPVT